jgi:hypothetical protein
MLREPSGPNSYEYITVRSVSKGLRLIHLQGENFATGLETQIWRR